jgi:cell division protein ZapA
MDPGASEKKPVRVTIFNQTYALRVSTKPGEVEELAASIDDLMANISSHAGTSDAGRVAVLACLHLADKLRTAERELALLRKRVGEESERFSDLLDKAIEPNLS